jgi:exopolyphosphatase / guanosine-5'-triphosphate,3'-diphosphate pyrophosphatase
VGAARDEEERVSGHRRLAAVDVGSNTIQALVADLRDGGLEDVDYFDAMPELGAEVDRTGRIGPAKSAEAIATLEAVLAPARRLGYERLLASATAAVRRARDGEAFLAAASAAIGEPVRLIGEQREAELSFLGAASRHAAAGGWLMGDMGGGSTELVVAEGMRALRWASLRIGSGALANRHLSDPPRPGERETLRAAAAAEVRRAPGCEAQKLVMTGGTASNLPLVLSTLSPPLVLTADDLLTAAERLDADTAAALAPRYGLAEARVRALRGGVELLLLLLDFYGLDRFHVSHAGLRQGMILAYLERGDDWWR